MHKYIFFGVVAIDETIAAFYVEPLNGSRYFFSCKIKLKEKIEIE